jgi:hypothetical protein
MCYVPSDSSLNLPIRKNYALIEQILHIIPNPLKGWNKGVSWRSSRPSKPPRFIHVFNRIWYYLLQNVRRFELTFYAAMSS